MALRLSPTSYPYLHTFSLPRTLLLAVPDTTRRPHLPSLTFSSSLAGCAWHFKDSLSSYGEKSFPFVPFFLPSSVYLFHVPPPAIDRNFPRAIFRFRPSVGPKAFRVVGPDMAVERRRWRRRWFLTLTFYDPSSPPATGLS